jgi:hypothetical protein
MRWLLVSSLLVPLVLVGCGREKTYGARDVKQAFASHGLRLIMTRSQPAPTFTTVRRPRHVMFIYRNHRDADAAVRREKARGVFSAFDIPRPVSIGGITVFTKRNIVAIDVTPNISTTPNVTRAVGTPGFKEAVEGLP